MASWIPLFALAFLTILNNSRGSLVTTPQPQEVTEGDSARFSCSTDSAYGGIDWKHSYVGAPRPHDVYVNGMLLNGYKEHGRYSVDASTPGSSILLIRNVQEHDTGVFICVDKNGAGESSSARLIVREKEEFVVVPRDTIVSAGQTVRLTCTTVEPKNVWWKRSRVGTTAENDVYMGVAGVVNGFAKGGRYSIDQDNSTGRYDLLIRTVEPADAGKFVCVSNAGLGKQRSAELTVTESYPKCSSYIPIDGVVGENSCGITPDEVVMFCNVNFTGNIPPELAWVHAQDDSQVKEGHIYRTNNPNSVMLTLRLRSPTSHADWTGIRCRIGNSRIEEHNCSPVTSPVKFINLSQSAKISTSKPKSVSCLLNSTERCQYRWIKVQDGIQTTVVNGHTLNLEDMGDFLCEASCTIRGQLCTMHPMSVVFHKDQYVVANQSGMLWILLAILGVLLLVTIICCVVLFMKLKGVEPGKILRFNGDIVRKLHPPANNGIRSRIASFTVLDAKVYVVFENSNIVHVYKGINSFRFIRKIEVTGMQDPRDIVGVTCNTLHYIYIADSSPCSHRCTTPCIWKVSVDERNDISKIFVPNLPSLSSHFLSVTSNGYMVVTANDATDKTLHKIVIYDKAGTPTMMNVNWENEPIRHAAMVSEDQWIVNVGGRIGLVDKNRNILQCYPARDDPAMTCDKCGQIVIGSDGFTYVVNCESHKIIILDKNLSAVDSIDLKNLRYKDELLQKCVVVENKLILGFTSGRILVKRLRRNIPDGDSGAPHRNPNDLPTGSQLVSVEIQNAVNLGILNEHTSSVNIQPEVGQLAVPEAAQPTASDAAQHADPETEHLLDLESNC